MTIAIPRNLVRAEHRADDHVFTFTVRSPKWQHVWTWDELNGQLHLAQFRRGHNVVKVQHWHSPNMLPDMLSARSMLRKTGDVQWFGRSAVDALRRAFTFA